MRSRLLCLAATALIGCIAAPVSAAHAAPTWPTIVKAQGTIYDVDAGRILFRKSNDQFAVMDRRTEAITPIPVVPNRPPRFGRLTSHGAILAVTSETGPSVFEWRDGQLIQRGVGYVDSLEVAGSHAAWSARPSFSDPPSVFHLDLDTGVVTPLATDAGSEDVADNGDVVYETGDHSIVRWRAGLATTLAASSGSVWAADPRTDGINAVWSEGPACDCTGDHSIHGYGPAGPFTLANTTRQGGINADREYRTAGGWIAFTRVGTGGPPTVWVRDPFGVETQIGNATLVPEIVALGTDGQAIFVSSTGHVLAVPGATPVPVGFPGELWTWARELHINYLFEAGSRWYGAIGNSIVRLSLTDEPTDGAETAIDSAPKGSVSSTAALMNAQPRKRSLRIHPSRTSKMTRRRASGSLVRLSTSLTNHSW